MRPKTTKKDLLIVHVITFLLFISSLGFAQKKVMVYVIANATLPMKVGEGKFKSSDLTTEFFTNYNTYNVHFLTKPFEHLKPQISPQFGINLMGKYVCFESTFQKFRAQSQASFTTGEVRHFEVSARGVDFKIGIGYNAKYFAIFATVGTQPWGKPTISTYMVYPDGTKSFGKEQMLNGYYQGNASILPSRQYGLMVAAGSKRLKVYCGIDKIFCKKQENNLGSSLVDEHKLSVMAASTSGGSYQIGVDWGKYVYDPSQYTLDNGKFIDAGGWNMVRMKVGILFNLVKGE